MESMIQVAPMSRYRFSFKPPSQPIRSNFRKLHISCASGNGIGNNGIGPGGGGGGKGDNDNSEDISSSDGFGMAPLLIWLLVADPKFKVLMEELEGVVDRVLGSKSSRPNLARFVMPVTLMYLLQQKASNSPFSLPSIIIFFYLFGNRFEGGTSGETSGESAVLEKGDGSGTCCASSTQSRASKREVELSARFRPSKGDVKLAVRF